MRNELEQDRQCTYNLILRRVRVTIVAVEKQFVLNIPRGGEREREERERGERQRVALLTYLFHGAESFLRS